MGVKSGPRKQPRQNRHVKRCKTCLQPFSKKHTSPYCGGNAANIKV